MATINKYDFIQELLSNKKLTQAQKEQILTLSASEIKKDKELGVVLEERITKLEQKIGLDDKIDLNEIIDEKTNEIDHLNQFTSTVYNTKSGLPKHYFYPRYLHNFFLAYNQDLVLKSTCHLIDSNEIEKIIEYCNTDEYDFKKHYEKILEAFKNLEKMVAPSYIKAMIRGYLTGKKHSGEKLSTWSSDKIPLHWGHNSLKEWCNQNKGIPPNPDNGIARKYKTLGFEFEEAIRVKGSYLQYFSQLVLHFKKMYHIRSDNSFLEILKKQNESKGWSNEIDFIIEDVDFPNNIEFFTDIDKLMQSYDAFIELIIECKKDQKPIVKLSLIEVSNVVSFSIHHINTTYGKSLESAKNRLIGQKYKGIINKLNGICDIRLNADFGQNNYAYIGIWDEFYNISLERDIYYTLETFKGVEHILLIPKN